VPHPFHVLCEMGGKPRNQPYRNCENALEETAIALEFRRFASVDMNFHSLACSLGNYVSASGFPSDLTISCWCDSP